MRLFTWIAILVTVLAIDIAVGLVLLVMSAAENCGDGNDSWECNGTLQDVLVVVLIALPAAYVVAALVAAARAYR